MILNEQGDPIDGSECTHSKTLPAFDEEAAKGLSASEVRQRWPRFDGQCPDCGTQMIAYASFLHYLMGDY